MFNYSAVKVYSVHKSVVPGGTLCINFCRGNQLAAPSCAALKHVTLAF